MKILGVIPARYASKRFPGKPLVDIDGKSMVRRVYEQARKCPDFDHVIIATDDDRIFNHVKSWGGEIMMTSGNHRNGTERCLEVAQSIGTDVDYIVNIQGDEPFVHPETLSQLCSLLDGEVTLGSVAKEVADPKELKNPHVVKVTFDTNGFALYFSRSCIPYIENHDLHAINEGPFFKHIGLYAYRRDVLHDIAQLPQGKLESRESLEQLRWLENGYRIKLAITTHESHSIDTPQDLKQILKQLL